MNAHIEFVVNLLPRCVYVRQPHEDLASPAPVALD
jgi:hypothetical protein